MALGRFLIQPEDDLSLAAVLRSPIFGVSEETLFELAAGAPAGQRSLAVAAGASRADTRSGRPWSRNSMPGPTRPPSGRCSSSMPACSAATACARRMIARLGQEAGDILDEFLSFCLAEERTGLPGLEAFLATLESAGPEIKREMDQARDEVRIMTVHAAKGLEAPVVFLVDGGAAPFSDQHLPRLMPFETRRIGWPGTGYLWRSASDVANGFSKAAAASGAGARRRRIPPPALCRHDARRGPADRLRLPWQARRRTRRPGMRSSAGRWSAPPRTRGTAASGHRRDRCIASA